MRPDAHQSVIQKINYLLFFILQSLSFTNKVLVNLFIKISISDDFCTLLMAYSKK